MTDSTPRIGFIGLGLMGQAFTQRLIDCGHDVAGYDTIQEKMTQAEGHGVTTTAHPAALAASSDIIMLCVTATPNVEDAVFGENGVVAGAAAGSILVDLSTTIVGDTRDMAARLRQEADMGWIDAPVSGGPEAAAAGSLAIMAGGDEADVAKVRPVMEQLSATFTLFGPAGSGQVAKMVNQVLVLNNYVILAEALALAEAGGIDASKIPAALASGHAGSNLLNAMFPRLIARDFEPRGYARQILKDLDMVHDLAKQLETPTPMSSQAASLYRVLNSKGHEELDGIAILKMFDRNENL